MTCIACLSCTRVRILDPGMPERWVERVGQGWRRILAPRGYKVYLHTELWSKPLLYANPEHPQAVLDASEVYSPFALTLAFFFQYTRRARSRRYLRVCKTIYLQSAANFCRATRKTFYPTHSTFLRISTLLLRKEKLTWLLFHVFHSRAESSKRGQNDRCK